MKIFNPTIKMLLLETMLIIIFTGCATIENDWEKVKIANTNQAYYAFILKHPNSEYATQASRLLKKAHALKDWEQAKKSDSKKGYEKFLESHPDSKFSSEAINRIWRIVRESESITQTYDSIEGYESFLEKYPDSQFGSIARSRIENLRIEQKNIIENFVKNNIQKVDIIITKKPQTIVTGSSFKKDIISGLSDIVYNYEKRTPLFGDTYVICRISYSNPNTQFYINNKNISMSDCTNCTDPLPVFDLEDLNLIHNPGDYGPWYEGGLREVKINYSDNPKDSGDKVNVMQVLFVASENWYKNASISFFHSEIPYTKYSIISDS